MYGGMVAVRAVSLVETQDIFFFMMLGEASNIANCPLGKMYKSNTIC